MISDSAKTILCYGDSNTWGNVPRSDRRWPRSVRWPSVLQSLLGDEYEVMSEGLCGRTFVAVDPERPHRTGITHLQAMLESNDPVDAVIIMLGTNDMKSTYGLDAKAIALHLEETIKLIKSDKLDLEQTPAILVVCPPAVIKPALKAKSPLGNELDERMVRALDISKELPNLFKIVAKKYGCLFLNAGDFICSSTIDGYHLDADGHLKLAHAISARVGVLKS